MSKDRVNVDSNELIGAVSSFKVSGNEIKNLCKELENDVSSINNISIYGNEFDVKSYGLDLLVSDLNSYFSSGYNSSYNKIYESAYNVLRFDKASLIQLSFIDGDEKRINEALEDFKKAAMDNPEEYEGLSTLLATLYGVNKKASVSSTIKNVLSEIYGESVAATILTDATNVATDLIAGDLKSAEKFFAKKFGENFGSEFGMSAGTTGLLASTIFSIGYSAYRYGEDGKYTSNENNDFKIDIAKNLSSFAINASLSSLEASSVAATLGISSGGAVVVVAGTGLLISSGANYLIDRVSGNYYLKGSKMKANGNFAEIEDLVNIKDYEVEKNGKKYNVDRITAMRYDYGNLSPDAKKLADKFFEASESEKGKLLEEYKKDSIKLDSGVIVYGDDPQKEFLDYLGKYSN